MSGPALFWITDADRIILGPKGLELYPGDILTRHLTRSLRAREGDSFRFVRPELSEELFVGVIANLSPLVVALSPASLEKTTPESAWTFDLAAGILKGDGFEDLIEPAVCLGVRTLYPIFSDRGQVHWDSDQFDRKRSRFESKIRESSQLAGRRDRMVIAPPCGLLSLLTEISSFVVFFDEKPDALSVGKALEMISPGAPVLGATGPEGGWSDRERAAVDELEKTGQACRASLGPLIFPGRLAPVVAASILSLGPGHKRN